MKAGLLIILLLVAYRVYQGAGRGGPVSLMLPPRVLEIAANKEIDIPPGQIQRWEWEAPANQPSCRITGRVEVLGGGNLDVQIMVLTVDDYANMVNGHESRSLFTTGKVTAQTLDIQTAQPGRFVLALSNSFSLVTAKHLRLEGVRVTCQ